MRQSAVDLYREGDMISKSLNVAVEGGACSKHGQDKSAGCVCMMKTKTERDVTRCLSNMRRSLNIASKKICTPVHVPARPTDKSKEKKADVRL